MQYKNKMTATWLIVLTMLVVAALPALLIMLTTYPPHPKLLLATQFPYYNSVQSYLSPSFNI